MHAVEVRDHIMIAHSFKGEFFGPAQAMHGATFVIDACFLSKTLDENNVVIDIGAAHDALKRFLNRSIIRILMRCQNLKAKTQQLSF